MRLGTKRGRCGMGAIAGFGLLACATLSSADVFTFQMGDGQAGTVGAKDTWIVKGPASNVNTDPDNTNNGADPKLRIRSQSSAGTNGERATLICFPNVLGTGAGQFDPSLPVVKATLRLTVATGSAGSNQIGVHQLLQDWDEGNGSFNIVDPTHTFFGATWNNAKAFPDGVGNTPWNPALAVDRTGVPARHDRR
jgi:hypothetical protein